MLDAFLRSHDGVITLAQARSAGLSQAAVQRRVRSGRWVRCARGVYFVDDRPFTDAARIRAAVWSYGPSAVGSGLTAAWWHGLTKFAPEVVEMTIPRDSNGRRRVGCRPRRRDLTRTDIVEVNGLNVTDLALTIVEAAARRGGGPKLLDWALQTTRIDLPALWAAHLRHTGRYGSPRSRRLLQAADNGARSEAERLLLRLLREAGISGWRANYRVGGYRVDVGFPGSKVAIEVDGFAFHSGAAEFQIDRTRQNDIVLMQWQVLRFTWLDLVEYPERVVQVIRAAISA
ncbi:type IV toxin-antitoxin system AbiEi family antitoxin domain-containing protein [Mycobacterium sp. SMC-4]|uniref:type IV toxin-antitoxin system AbiEi family antitoxin domain-containing protein n=1 Tax=Mycobacterium sp. SMC-4 TaxID=2857059 RepID=UPI003CFC7097